MAANTQTPPDLAAENNSLRQRVADLEAGQKRAKEDEKAIREKMAAGLPREQAEAAVRHQAAYDKQLAAMKARSKKA